LVQSECKGPDSWLYEYTHHGLDEMMQQYLEYGLTIDNYQYMVSQEGGELALHRTTRNESLSRQPAGGYV
jgi:hypothetical protein